MSRFTIQAAHTPEGCLQTLDEVLALGPSALANYDFACAVGDHSNHMCYTIVEAANEAAARATLPERVRSTAQVVEVGKFTPEQIRSFHQGG
jgi:hypothetical protein